jgi:multidrug resistance efflux pump
MNTPSRRRAPRRWLSFVPLVGAAVLALSTAGAGWILRSHADERGGASAGNLSADGSAPVVFCLGYVDVEGGVAYPYPLAPGRVVEVPVQEGQGLKAGAVLFRMDDTLARRDLEVSRAGVTSAEKQLDKARNGKERHAQMVVAQTKARDAARHGVEAARALAREARRVAGVTGSGVSEAQADAADARVKQAEDAAGGEEAKLEALKLEARDLALTVAMAEQDVAHKTALLGKAQYALDECAVKAPADGEVLRLAVLPGDLLGPQAKAPPIIFCPARPRVVRAEIDQEWAGRAAEGQLASIQDETSSGGPTWKGKVTRLADWMGPRRMILPDPSQFHDVRTLECVVQIDPGQPPLRIGQRVRVTLSNP